MFKIVRAVNGILPQIRPAVSFAPANTSICTNMPVICATTISLTMAQTTMVV